MSGEVVGVLFVDHGCIFGGRNRERSMEFALLMSEVTPSVARLPCNRWRAVALLMNTMEIKRDLIFIKSSSFAVAHVFLIRSEKPVA